MAALGETSQGFVSLLNASKAELWLDISPGGRATWTHLLDVFALSCFQAMVGSSVSWV